MKIEFYRMRIEGGQASRVGEDRVMRNDFDIGAAFVEPKRALPRRNDIDLADPAGETIQRPERKLQFPMVAIALRTPVDLARLMPVIAQRRFEFATP